MLPITLCNWQGKSWFSKAVFGTVDSIRNKLNVGWKRNWNSRVFSTYWKWINHPTCGGKA